MAVRLLLVLLAAVLWGDTRTSGADSRPNILFCVADDVSYPHMSAYGCTWVKTPGFDRVARDGLLFTRAYTPNAKCSPSRACILTGRNSWQLGAACNHWCYFPAEFKTYPEALGEHGYFVGLTGKGWAPGTADSAEGQPRSLVGQGFNRRRLKPPAKGVAGHDYAANFLDFLEAAPADQPWCFWYGGYEAHRAYEYEVGLRLGGKKLTDIDRVPGFFPDNDVVRTDLLDYAYEIEWFDRHLRRMLDELERRGQLDNTLVVVTADNGMPFPRVKGQEYEMSNHLPLAIMWKQGIEQPGRVVADYVSFVDFAPTFVEVAGLDWKEIGLSPTPGRSLTDTFQARAAPDAPARDHVLIGKERHDVGRPGDVGYPVRGIVKDGLMYLENFEPSRWPACNPETGYLNVDGSPTKTEVIKSRSDPATRKYWWMSFGIRGGEELFNVVDDPECLRNLADEPQYADAKARLKAQMHDELRAQGDPRMLGQGEIFDAFPYGDDNNRGFYERFLNGEIGKPGWVNPTDFETVTGEDALPPRQP